MAGLRDSFLTMAFSPAEQNQILLVTNANPNNPQFGTRGGNQTQDRLFLLSIDEAGRYFSKDSQRACAATAYARAYDIYTGENGASWWWLRSPGEHQNEAAIVNPDGSVFSAGYGVQNEYGVVRPAFWMKTAPAPTPTPTPKPTPTQPACYKVTYKGNNCLTTVPVDKKCYRPGDRVTVLFEPVEYVGGMIFNGWDQNLDGSADFGYYYPSFVMPAHDVELNAICYYPNNEWYYEQIIIDDDNAYDYNYDYDYDYGYDDYFPPVNNQYIPPVIIYPTPNYDGLG